MDKDTFGSLVYTCGKIYGLPVYTLRDIFVLTQVLTGVSRELQGRYKNSNGFLYLKSMAKYITINLSIRDLFFG